MSNPLPRHELEREIEQLRAENVRLRVALRGLLRGDCFCGAAVDNPMMGGTHDADCIRATQALGDVVSDFLRERVPNFCRVCGSQFCLRHPKP